MIKRMRNKKFFIITIDTEGDNLWSSPKKITTKNARYLAKFQQLCDKYNYYPTYLTNYEMAKDPVFIDFGKYIINNKIGEIGMHIHAWNNPPLKKLTTNDFKYQPYLIEYPKQVIREKINYQINLLENTFQIKILSHRAGRWAMNEYYAKILFEYGIRVDCSVTPHVNWESNLGNPFGNGGSNYSNYKKDSYFLSLDNLVEEDVSFNSIIEVPVSIRQRTYNDIIENLKKNKNKFVRRAIEHFYPEYIWMRPSGKNLKHLLWLIDNLSIEKTDYIELILHSSELMPGGSPNFRTNKSIKKLYSDLNVIFQYLSNVGYTGSTLSQYYFNKINGLQKQNKSK